MSQGQCDSLQFPQTVKEKSVLSGHQNKGYNKSDVNRDRFPIRPMINMALIIFITFQVYIVATSRMYLRGSLNRSFLQLYAQDQKYPQLFLGQSFYLTIRNISEIKQNLEYTFDQMREIKNNSFLITDLQDSIITLSVQYLNNLQTKQLQKQFIIDPEIGIIQPFNMSNIEQIQKFLIKVNWFKLIVQNITVQSEGFFQKYYHQVKYDFEQGLEIVVNYKFSIDNTMLNGLLFQKPQATFQFFIRTYFLTIMFLAIFSIYLNYRYIRRTMKVIFKQLGKKEINKNDIQQSLVNAQDMAQINQAVLKWIKINKLTLQKLNFRHYFYIIEFDILFSIISNIFTIVGSFYLFIGFERQIIIGISCLTSWMTIFKFLRSYKKLVLMYELIKLSIVKVLFFFIQFFPVFLAYTFLGMCLFPKVSFFSCLAKSVTTLVSLMMGDSIQMITVAMAEKNSMSMSIVYIFTFVLMFMHAIHNTLTSLIKEAFILKKIQLIKQEKNKKNQNQFLYISEIKCKFDEGNFLNKIEKQKLPLVLTESLKRDLLRIDKLKRSKFFQSRIKKWSNQWQKLFFHQKWQIEQNQTIFKSKPYQQELLRRLQLISKILISLFGQGQNYQLSKERSIPEESLITND